MQSLLGPLALGQVEHESDDMGFGSLNARYADQHRHAAPVFPEVFFLERLGGAGQRKLGESLFGAIDPFRRRHGHPADTAGKEIVPIIPYDAKIGIIGFDQSTVALPDADPDDVGVEQPPDLGVAFTERLLGPLVVGQEALIHRR